MITVKSSSVSLRQRVMQRKNGRGCVHLVLNKEIKRTHCERLKLLEAAAAKPAAVAVRANSFMTD